MITLGVITDVKGLITDLLLVALVAFAVYAICTWLAHRPDVGSKAAAVIAVLGCILVLLDYL